MATATQVVARFTADISDVQSKMGAAQSAFTAVGDAAQFTSKRIAAVGQSMAEVGKKMTVGITLPLGGIAVAASNAAMSFETNMTKITALVGIASEEVQRMGSEVLNMASAVGKAPDELANGLFVVTSAGLRGSEAMSTLKNAARAGAAGLGETNDIARAVSGALSAYGSDVLSAAAATDAIVATARAGNFETSQFAAAIGRVLPFAQQAGASFQDMGGAVALLTRVNGDAAQSVTQMQALFRAFVVPTEEAKTALDEVGLSAQDLRDSIAEKGLPATLKMLDNALGGNREQLGRLLGSSEAASAAFQILEADARTIKDTFGVVAGSAGMTNDAFNTVSQTTQFQMSAAMAELKAGLIDLGNSLLPVVRAIIDFAARWIAGFNSLPGPIKTTITIIGGLAAAMGPLLFIVGKLIVVFSTLLGFILKLKAVQALRTAFMQVRGELALTRASMAQTQTSMGMMATAAHMAKVGIVTSFRGIMIAARSLLASLGPIGLALIGVTFAMDGFLGRSAAVEDIMQTLTDEVDLATQSLTNYGKQLAAQKVFELISEEDRAALAAYGITMGEVTNAVIAGGPAYDALMEKIRAFRDVEINPFGRFGADQIRMDIENVRAGVEGSIEAANSLEEANLQAAVAASDGARGMAASYRATAAEQRALASGTASNGTLMQNVMDKTAEAVRGLQAAFTELNEITSDVRAADAAKDAYEKLTAGLEENGKGFSRATEEQKANRDNLLDYIDAQVAFAESLDKPQEQLNALRELEADVKKSLKAGGVKAKDSALYKSIEEAINEAEKKVKGMKTAVDDAKDNGLKVSEAIALGIEQGMTQQESTLNAAGVYAGDTTAEGLYTALGMRSPSKVAMDAGRNTGIGLIQGLKQMGPAAQGAGMNVGAQVVRGMLNSLNNGEGPVASAARRIVAAAIAAAKEEAGITSPSRVFAGIGDDMVRGAVVGVTRSTPQAEESGSRLARGLAAAFADAMRGEGASIAQAINEVFGGIPMKTPLERLLGVEDAEKFVKNNKKAIQALAELGEAFDMIAAKVAIAVGAITQLTELTARPFGRPSELMNMFGSRTDIDGVIDGYLSLSETITQAFSVLTDASIVGDKAARANRKNLQSILKQLENLTRRAIALREEYEANLQALADLETDYANRQSEINARYDQLDKEAADNIKAIQDRWAQVIPGLQSAADSARAAYERENSALQALIAERDGFLKQIADGARSFLNSLSFTKRKTEAVAKQAAPEKQIIETFQDLGNGIRVVTKREITPAAEAAVEAVEHPLAAMDIRSQLETRLGDLRTFTQNIRTLVERGLDPELVRQFVNAGVSGAGEAAAALAAGSADEIAAINSVQNALAAEVASFGEYASAEWHDAAIAQQEAVVGAALTQQQAADRALAQANTLRDAELKAAQQHADNLRIMRQNELDAAEAWYNAERGRLEARNRELMTQMDAIAQLISNWMTRIARRLPTETEDAGQDAARKLLAGFRKAFPDVSDRLNKLMDQLAKSMNRVVTVTVRTVYEASRVPGRAMGGPVQARNAYVVGERGPELFVPYANGNILPNRLMGTVPPMGARAANGNAGTVIQVNVNAGIGTDGAEVGRKVVDVLRQYERRNGPLPIKVAG